MLKKLRNALRQLRWKLTLSYTAVAVGTLLIMLSVLVFLILSTVLVPSEALTPELWIEATQQQVVPIIQGLLANSPPDLVQLDTILQGIDQLDTSITGREIFGVGPLQLLVRTTAEVDFIVVGPDGSLLGSSQSALVPAAAVGELFDLDQVPGLAEPLAAAMAGETDPDKLFATIRPDDEFIWAVPVWGAGRTEGQVLGALVVRLSSLPSRTDLTYYALTLIARGLLVFIVAAGLIGGVFGSLTAEGMVSRFGRLWTAVEAWSKGDFSRFVHDRSGDEISQFAGRLNTMAVQLKSLLRDRQQIAVAEERNRLARDLHDSAKQQALAASFQLGTALTLLDSDPQTAKKHLQEADNLIDLVRQELTDLIHELRPPSSGRWELETALREYVTDWTHQNNIRTEVSAQGEGEFPLEREQAIYRIVQEALSNVARHSQATQVAITLQREVDRLALTVSDNGVGFDPQVQHRGMGLHSMHERAESLHGSFSIQSQANHGTVISVTLPQDELKGANYV